MINRTVLKQIEISVKTKPVTLITGARQVGKTTLATLFIEKGFSYVSLDSPREREMAREDPELFLSLHPWPLIIDEIQKAPGLFDAMESVVNKEKINNPHNYGMYIITGSQAYRLMQGVTESMAGRISIIHMLPLSRSEILGQEEPPFNFDLASIQNRATASPLPPLSLYEEIVRGHFPELYDNENINQDTFYEDYIESYIERDVSEIINVRDKLAFRRYMEVLASLTGQELIYNNIAKAIEMDVKTIQAWTSVLLAGDIIHLLEPYNDTSVIKRVVKRPKVYFSDTGLACHLLKVNSAATLASSFFSGGFVETYVVNEIRSSYLNNRKNVGLYYYRDNNGNEIDLLVLKDGSLHRIEIKSGIAYDSKAIKAFKQVEGTSYNLGTSLLICSTDKVYPIVKGQVYAIPIAGI
ncbi:MAG: ATP-binding protein [Bacilli bacterium]|nr:ATP-binding protein [Bacilli bacterium]